MLTLSITSTIIWLQILKLWHRYLHPLIPSDVTKSLAMHRDFAHIFSQSLMMETLSPFTGLQCNCPMSWTLNCPFIWIPGREICLQFSFFRKRHVVESESKTSANSVPPYLARGVIDTLHRGSKCRNAIFSTWNVTKEYLYMKHQGASQHKDDALPV